MTLLTRREERFKKKCAEYHTSNDKKKEALRQHEAFCQWLLKEKRCTKEEMKPFFKRKSQLDGVGVKK